MIRRGLRRELGFAALARITDEAICVRHWDWSETSQTVALFTREHGLLRGLAKGAKREKSAFSGGFELLTRGEVGAIVKPSGGLATLTSWDLREAFLGFRRSLRAHYAGLYVADLVGSLLTEEDPHPALYDRTVEALRALAEAGGSGGRLAEQARVLAGYQLAILDETGYRPELTADVRTGAAITAAEVYGFDAELGGLVPDAGSERAGVWRVRAETLDLLRALQSRDEKHSANGGEAGPTGKIGTPNQVGTGLASGESLWRANRLLAAYIRAKLGEEPRSMRLLLAEFPRSEGDS